MNRTRRTLALAPPVMIIAAGLFWLSGCIPLPGSYRRVDGQPRIETQIGDARSRQPIRLNVSTRPDVEALFSPPAGRSADDQLWAYTYAIDTGGWFWPFCLMYERGPSPMNFGGYYGTPRYVFLEFDEAGVLRSSKPRSAQEATAEGLRGRVEIRSPLGVRFVPSTSTTQSSEAPPQP